MVYTQKVRTCKEPRSYIRTIPYCKDTFLQLIIYRLFKYTQGLKFQSQIGYQQGTIDEAMNSIWLTDRPAKYIGNKIPGAIYTNFWEKLDSTTNLEKWNISICFNSFQYMLVYLPHAFPPSLLEDMVLALAVFHLELHLTNSGEGYLRCKS